MLTASFNNGDKVTEVSGLRQWDYGQVLKICGLHIHEKTVEVHFSVSGGCEALIQFVTVEDSDIFVDIPNELLEVGRDIKAYVFVSDEVSGNTIREITIGVERRPKPKDYSAPADKNLLRQLIEKVEGKADNAKVIDGCLQLLSGEKEIGDRIRLPAGGSESGGREIELRNNGAVIQWRYTDSNEWTDLIQITELKGADGETPEFEIRAGHLYAIYKN